MNENFKLAATIMLKRRLKSLVSINNNFEIDKNYITYAEYQLFINDMQALGKNRQLDPWVTNKLSSKNVKKPIVGVRASDAQEFCEWLNNKYPLLGYKYRLPTLTEVAMNPSSENQIGCWCIDENQLIIGGINEEQWIIWQKQLKNSLSFEKDIDNNLHINLNDILSWEVNLNVDFPSQHFQIIALAQELSVILINNFSSQFDKRVRGSSGDSLKKKLINILKTPLNITLDFAAFITWLNILIIKFLFVGAINLIKLIYNFISFSSLSNNKTTINSSTKTTTSSSFERVLQAANETVSRFDESYTKYCSQQKNLINIHNQLQTNQHEAVFSERNSLIKFLDTIKFDLNCVLDLDMNLDSAFVNVFNRHQNYNLNVLKSIHYYLLVGAICWGVLSTKNEHKYQNYSLSYIEYYLSFVRNKNKQLNKYSIYKNIFLNSYTFFSLLENRINGSMPCWEGIRIAREKIKYK